MTDLPAEVREKAARAAADAQHDIVCGFDEPPLSDRDFGVMIVAWRAVVDAVAEVLAERRTSFSDVEWARAYRRQGAEVSSLQDEVDRLEAERDALSTMLRGMARRASVYRKGIRLWRKDISDLLDQLDAAERKLVKQRRRRKAAEAKVAEMEAELDRISNGWASRIESRRAVEAERDALQARVGKLRAALERVGEAFADAALTADDRAAGRTEEKT